MTTSVAFFLSWDPTQPFITQGLWACCTLCLEPFKSQPECHHLREVHPWPPNLHPIVILPQSLFISSIWTSPSSLAFSGWKMTGKSISEEMATYTEALRTGEDLRVARSQWGHEWRQGQFRLCCARRLRMQCQNQSPPQAGPRGPMSPCSGVENTPVPLN